MLSFQEKFCDAHHCTPEDFKRRVFWRCLRRHALPFAPILLLFKPGYFYCDWELITAAGCALSLNTVQAEIGEFFCDTRNRGWWRRRLEIRVSGRRLSRLAAAYLADPP